MSHPINNILGDPTLFFTSILKHLCQDGIDTTELICDHICFRVETPARYDYFKKALVPLGQLISEKVIGGRPIATFLLAKPIEALGYSIECLELPFPKTGSPYSEGYEHVEFVIQTSFAHFMGKYPEIKFITKGSDKTINPDIRISYGNKNVKFHHHPLSYVVRHLDPDD